MFVANADNKQFVKLSLLAFSRTFSTDEAAGNKMSVNLIEKK